MKKISAHHLYQETFQVRLLCPTQSINCYPKIWLNPLIYLSFAVLKYYFNKLRCRFNVSVLHVLICHNLHKEMRALIMCTRRQMFIYQLQNAKRKCYQLKLVSEGLSHGNLITQQYYRTTFLEGLDHVTHRGKYVPQALLVVRISTCKELCGTP